MEDGSSVTGVAIHQTKMLVAAGQGIMTGMNLREEEEGEEGGGDTTIKIAKCH